MKGSRDNGGRPHPGHLQDIIVLLKTPAASRQQGHAEGGSEAETEKTLQQEVPDGGADSQANHREQGELSGFWLNHGATLHP